MVVGSLGLDSLRTPAGAVDETLGGSASYFSLAASLYTAVWLVATVGADFPTQYRSMLEKPAIDLDGLEISPDKTFRWSGMYGADLNVAQTLDLQLNCFADFHPRLPDRYLESEYLFIANIQPALQLEVLQQAKHARLIAVDSRDLWIEQERDAFTEVLRHAHLVLLNDAEVRQYSGEQNLIAAARHLLTLGPQAVVVKKGEHGALLFGPNNAVFAIPAYPHAQVADPTGAGDSFAGALMGYLARADNLSESALRRAVVHGSAVASFMVESFGVDRLQRLTMPEIHTRYAALRQLTYVEEEPD